MLNPGIIQLIGFSSLHGVYGKNSIVFSRLARSSSFFLPFCVFCIFMFHARAWGALYAPWSFDLGQKEIENQAFCMFAAVPNDHW